MKNTMVIRVLRNYSSNEVVSTIDTHSDIWIGDYVEVLNGKYQYSTYTTAFKYFWGDERSTNLSDVKDNVWKVINMACHSGFYNSILVHIRNRKGDNVVIGLGGLVKSKFHSKNREPINDVVIYQLPYIGDVVPHDWHEKLWDYYENGKIIKKEKH